MENHEAIYEKVKSCLVDVLGVDDDDIEKGSALIEDLGAESIDFVDIIFRLEKTFGIQIPRGELFPQDFFNNKEYVADGKLTARGLETFGKEYPFIELKSAGKDVKVSDLSKFYTVDMLVKFVDRKQQLKAA